MTPVRTAVTITLCNALAACVANPTPHPSAPTSADTMVADVHVADPSPTVCAGMGGAWSDDDGVCDLALESELDMEDQSSQGAGDFSSPPATVASVTASGEPGGYTFTVAVRSDDKDCGQYTDWWEVVTFAGGLRYRHLMSEAHASGQPFTTSGGPVPVEADDKIIVRAHMKPGGYGDQAYAGTVASGFAPSRLPAGFAWGLGSADPQAGVCSE